MERNVFQDLLELRNSKMSSDGSRDSYLCEGSDKLVAIWVPVVVILTMSPSCQMENEEHHY